MNKGLQQDPTIRAFQQFIDNLNKVVEILK